MKICLIVNPYGGNQKGIHVLEKVSPLFLEADIDVKVLKTTHAGHARQIANEFDLTGYDGLCLIGGDGTMSEVLNGLLKRNDGIRIPVGMISGGSGNSFMFDLDMVDPLRGAQAIAGRKTMPIDVIEVTMEKDGTTNYAFNIMGWGIVTDIAYKAQLYPWIWFGESRYTIVSLMEIFSYKPRIADLYLDGEKISDEFVFAIACNTMYTGRGMKMAPRAKLNDGKFDVVVVRQRASRMKLLNLFPKIFDGSHINDPLCEYFQVKEMRIKPEVNEILNLDGEIFGSTPVTLKIIPKAFETFVI